MVRVFLYAEGYRKRITPTTMYAPISRTACSMSSSEASDRYWTKLTRMMSPSSCPRNSPALARTFRVCNSWARERFWACSWSFTSLRRAFRTLSRWLHTRGCGHVQDSARSAPFCSHCSRWLPTCWRNWSLHRLTCGCGLLRGRSSSAGVIGGSLSGLRGVEMLCCLLESVGE